MRTCICLSTLMAVALLLAIPNGTTAQEAVAPSADKLEGTARAVLAALQTSKPEGVYEKLSPGRRGEIDLLQARAKRCIERKQLTWKDVEEVLQKNPGLDPASKLGLKDVDGFNTLTPAQFCCLFFGVYQFSADAGLAAKISDRWFMTRRAVGSLMADMDIGRSPLSILSELGGEVRLESIDGLKLLVTCIAEGSTWYVHDLTLEIPNEKFVLQHQLRNVAKFVMGSEDEVRKAKASEGEQLLGSMKGQARVAYAKAGSAPTKLSGEMNGTGCGVDEAELKGKCYRARDAVYGNNNWGALVAEPVTATDIWILLVFLWAKGTQEIKSYTTKDLLETGLAELNREGYDPPDTK